MKKPTSSKSFKEIHYETLSKSLRWQNTPIQLYPLSQLSTFLKIPTPLVKVDYNFLLFINKGILYEQIGTEKLALESALVFVKTGAIIAIDEMTANIDGYFLLMEEEALQCIFNPNNILHLQHAHSILKLDDKHKAWFALLYEALIIELYNAPPNLDTAYSIVQVILHKYLQLGAKLPIETRAQQIALEFKSLIDIHYKKQKSPIFYANTLQISSNYLNRCVQMVFEKSAKELILEVLILQSQLCLLDKTKGIAEVCCELDIQDPSYFSRLFKKITGETPREYQQQTSHILY